MNFFFRLYMQSREVTVIHEGASIIKNTLQNFIYADLILNQFQIKILKYKNIKHFERL